MKFLSYSCKPKIPSPVFIFAMFEHVPSGLLYVKHGKHISMSLDETNEIQHLTL